MLKLKTWKALIGPIVFCIGLIIILIALDMYRENKEHVTETEINNGNFYYEVKLEVTFIHTKEAAIDVYGATQGYGLPVYGYAADGIYSAKIEIDDPTLNLKLEDGNFSYAKSIKFGESYKWITVASFVKKYKVLGIKKRYY